MKKDKNIILDTISAAEAQTLSGLLQCRIKRSHDLPAYHQYNHGQQQFISYSWRQIDDLVSKYQLGLQQESLNKGDRLAILLGNSIEWVAFEQAALALGLVVVPLYTWDSPENIAYILGNSGSRLLICQESEQWSKLLPHIDMFPNLEKLLCYEETEPINSPTLSLSTISHWHDHASLELESPSISPDEPATIVYTSGTTGPPKGVILSHRNILWNTEATLKVVPCYTTDIFLSFLPLSHTFERTVGYYAPMMGGGSVAYVRSIKELSEDLQTIRPTVIVSVPRIYEKIYSKIYQQMEQKPAFALKLLQTAIDIGWKLFSEKQGQKSTISPFERLLWPLLNKLVAQKVLDRLGGRIRIAVSGGAPLHEEVSKLFLGLGLPLLQGYGLTEASPVVSTNLLTDNEPTSVGPPLPDVQLKIGAQEELYVKSPGIMLGYWYLAEKTTETIDDDGWLHTGDVVEIRDGHIFIRGRLKEILVTSTGEKVPPADLELTITNDHLFDHVMAVGEGRPYIGALVVMEEERWKKLAMELSLDPKDPASLVSPLANQAVLDKIQQLTHAFPVYAQIRAVCLLLDEWNIENGLLTPTLKLKRQAIEELYNEKIAELYKGHELH